MGMLGRCGLPFLHAPIIVVLTVLVRDIVCLKLVSLEIPQFVEPGQSVSLTCTYDLQGDGLYSVKWYRDDMEFFRFVPSDKPPGQFFPIAGVQIDPERSGNGTVHIVEVDSSTTGTYRCEVSAEAPSFQTVQAEKMMTIYSLSDKCSHQSDISWVLSLFVFINVMAAIV